VGHFEDQLRRYVGSAHALAVSSGTAALALGLMAAGIGPGSRVACPVFTFAATPSAILLAGATPVLVPVDEDLHIDLGAFEEILPEVDAAMVVHMRGGAEDMDAVLALAEHAGVAVFEDAVPAMGVRLRGRFLGTFGLAGSFSTQSDKSINTGEGGALVSDDVDLIARAAVLSGAYEGRVRRHVASTALDDVTLPLYSFRMDELRGAMAAVQLESLPTRLDALAANYSRITAGLMHIPGIRPRSSVDGAVLGDALLLRIEGATPQEAQWFAQALRAEGIDARSFSDPVDRNVRAFWNWRFLDPVGSLTPMSPTHCRQLDVTREHVSRMVDIPLSAGLGEQDCQDLIDAVELVANHLRALRRAL
jgi:dTDP-4-amino-4,6-dideoxygalactose transaminase